ncbi:hypothetical protein MH117_22225 [Paenibacillus sp. ACRRX]|uniref:hypothetical protein n=1 Tax=Paenibacillus sp. ACRRX TaxID=2918206 RepID=UPI001EF571D9|nr:hypothetical protein [Paenibacillus sp. ACRRX]MCG7410135.1 hypothetical protein [Paenibacillus sp. ACRRX]
MVHKLPNGLNKFDSNDYVRREHFNEQWETIDSAIGTLRAVNNDIRKEVMDVIRPELEETPVIAIELKEKLQKVSVPRDTPFNVKAINGRTLINLLGFDGEGICTNRWTGNGLTTDGESISSVIPQGATVTDAFHRVPYDPTRNYIVIAEVKSTSTARIRLIEENGNEVFTSVVSSTFKPHVIMVDKGKLSGANPVHFSVVVQGKSGDEVFIKKARVYAVADNTYTAFRSLALEEIEERFPFVNGMTNINNPYAKITGSNLVPAFTQWFLDPITILHDSYVIQATTKAEWSRVGYYTFPVLANQTYTYSCTVGGYISASVTPYMTLEFLDHSGTSLGFNDVKPSGNGVIRSSVKAPVGAVRASFILAAGGIGTYSYSNPMLAVDAETNSFTPHGQSLWAAECELAAHPIDGSNADKLFISDDGTPKLLEKWEKVTLDGSEPWQFSSFAAGVKQVRIKNYVPIHSSTESIYHMFGVKHDGSQLKPDGHVITPDTFIFQPETGHLYVGISNVNSGWGESYTPSVDEVKAYFMGWRMTTQESWNSTLEPFNGEGTKGWSAIYCGKGTPFMYANGTVVSGSGVGTLPTSINPYNYRGYKLQYLKLVPTIEAVKNYEIGATLFKGANMVEAGSGIVLSERVYSVLTTDTAAAIGDINSPLKQDIKKALYISVNGKQDLNWYTSAINPAGQEKFRTLIQGYNPKKTYWATYVSLTPSVSPIIETALSSSLRGTVSNLVQQTGDMERRLTVIENYSSVTDTPQWVKPTLLNGWTAFEHLPVGYRKIHDVVKLKGRLASGSVGLNIPAFVLPEGYRPKTSTYLTVNDFTVSSRYICVHPDGTVIIEMGPSNSICLDGITFDIS